VVTEYESLLRRERASADPFETARERGGTKPVRKKKEKAAVLTGRLGGWDGSNAGTDPVLW
jgi:hypothetical protein